MSKGKILVVDDEPEIVRAISMRLAANGYDVVTAKDGAQATNVALKERPDVIILDFGMPAGSGQVVARRLRDMQCSTRPRVQPPCRRINHYGLRRPQTRFARTGLFG